MIKSFVEAYESRKEWLKEELKKAHPENYIDLVCLTLKAIKVGAEDDLEESMYDWDLPDPEKVHEIDDGDYQGTLVFVIPCGGYQPSRYWYLRVSYGSCSGCDTLQNICGYSSEPPTSDQIKDYMSLCLHIVQQLKEMDGREV